MTAADPNATPHCQHDDAFYANPDYQSIIDAQAWEIQMEKIANGIYDNPDEGGEGEE